jgi:catechol 2,3-dioxygenase-like lactoylglutathione lyase family enzyme
MRNFHHIAYSTNDLDAAMAQATRLLGVGPFQVLEHVDLGDFRFRGEPATLDHSAAFAAWGPVLLELDQVHEVRPAALREALGVRPGTVSHVAWTTDDLGAEREHLAAAGCGLLTTSAGGAVADWFSGDSLFGHPVEIHQPGQPVLDFWASVRAGASGQ